MQPVVLIPIDSSLTEWSKQVVCAEIREQQGIHCTGKTGKMAKRIPCQGKHREFGNIAKTQGIWFSHFVNSLILKVKDILIFPAKISKHF